MGEGEQAASCKAREWALHGVDRVAVVDVVVGIWIPLVRGCVTLSRTLIASQAFANDRRASGCPNSLLSDRLNR